MTDTTERGQSSVVGSILLVGLVVVSTTLVGGYGFYTVTQTSDSADHFVDDTAVVTQTGGEPVDETDLDVVFRNVSDESRVGFVVDDGDGDSVFETGESARFGSVATETEVLVVSEQSVVCRDTIIPPDSEAGEDANEGDGDSENDGGDGSDDGDSDEDTESDDDDTGDDDGGDG